MQVLEKNRYNNTVAEMTSFLFLNIARASIVEKIYLQNSVVQYPRTGQFLLTLSSL